MRDCIEQAKKDQRDSRGLALPSPDVFLALCAGALEGPSLSTSTEIPEQIRPLVVETIAKVTKAAAFIIKHDPQSDVDYYSAQVEHHVRTLREFMSNNVGDFNSLPLENQREAIHNLSLLFLNERSLRRLLAIEQRPPRDLLEDIASANDKLPREFALNASSVPDVVRKQLVSFATFARERVGELEKVEGEMTKIISPILKEAREKGYPLLWVRLNK